jgi:hypothetical protein
LSWLASILIFLVVLPFSSGQSLVQRFLGHEAVRSGNQLTFSFYLLLSSKTMSFVPYFRRFCSIHSHVLA